ncbi:RDD family protein [Cognaticolwellia beringensis]|uniref:RDD family protein n=2 Tax=Cognaticolwellia beringensis TaxID=1967665 RepID=A0A222GDW2_9GAMM|nr:RDD family protein [Cognaticolwellia beringensis]
MTINGQSVQYVGFWSRLGASVIDSIIIILLTYPILYFIYGAQYFDSDVSSQGWTDFIVSYLLPVVAVILFWVYKSATPGKMAVSAKIVDENTGNKPSTQQFIIRYLGYYVSILALGLGFFWIAWDEKKQGWHDKMASTVVIVDNKSR